MYSEIERGSEYINRLTEVIRNEYGITATGITPAKRGYYGETWRLEASERSYFVKLDYSSVHKLVYERSFYVMEHLREREIDFISRVVKTSGGELSAKFDGAVLGVFDWIDGENVQNERTKIEEYCMLAKIYAVSGEGRMLPREDFSGKSADLFFAQLKRLGNSEKNEEKARILALFEQKSEKIKHRAQRLKLFADRCRGDKSHFYITHGDAGGNIITSGENFFIVDWDAPMLAPPERDAWFCLYWSWAGEAFNRELQRNGIAYELRPERLAYYCYYSFFFYLTEYLETYFDIGGVGGKMIEALEDYFGCWIEEEIRYADML